MSGQEIRFLGIDVDSTTPGKVGIRIVAKACPVFLEFFDPSPGFAFAVVVAFVVVGAPAVIFPDRAAKGFSALGEKTVDFFQERVHNFPSVHSSG